MHVGRQGRRRRRRPRRRLHAPALRRATRRAPRRRRRPDGPRRRRILGCRHDARRRSSTRRTTTGSARTTTLGFSAHPPGDRHLDDPQRDRRPSSTTLLDGAAAAGRHADAGPSTAGGPTARCCRVGTLHLGRHARPTDAATISQAVAVEMNAFAIATVGRDARRAARRSRSTVTSAEPLSTTPRAVRHPAGQGRPGASR